MSAGATELPMLMRAEGVPERLVIIGLLRDGRVELREWSGADWSRPATTRTVEAAGFYREIEAAVRRGVSLNVEMYAVRIWLGVAG
ncbi:MAG: hypothetical protein JWO05_2169 [Gemmatimonadetes bacterium]|nr:hypothetical protein [Gemmatimonadota bacterium]